MEKRTQRKLTLATCSWAHGVQDGLSATLFVFLPILAQTFGLSYAEVGIVRATKTVAATLFELPSGMLAEWLGERRLIVFGLACAGVGMCCSAMPNPPDDCRPPDRAPPRPPRPP